MQSLPSIPLRRVSVEGVSSTPPEPLFLGSSILQLLRRKWAVAIFGFAVVLLPALAWTWMAPAVFSAEVKLFVKPRRIEASKPLGFEGERPETEIGSELELLGSRGVLLQVLQRTDLADSEEGNTPAERIERALTHLSSALEISVLPKTSVISVRYVDPNPQRAADVLNYLADGYLERRASLQRPVEGVLFLDEQVAKAAEELRIAEADLSEFLEAHRISILEVQKETNLRRLDKLEAELTSLEANSRGLDAQDESYRSLRLKLQNDSERQQSRAEGASLRARRAELEKKVGEYRTRQQELQNVTTDHDRLRRRVQNAERNLRLYEHRMREASIERSLDEQKILEVSIVDRATRPSLPIDHHTPLMLLLSVLAAALSGVGVALLADLRDPRVRSVSELERLTGKPVLDLPSTWA